MYSEIKRANAIIFKTLLFLMFHVQHAYSILHEVFSKKFLRYIVQTYQQKYSKLNQYLNITILCY